MNFDDLISQSLDKLRDFDPNDLMPKLGQAYDGAKEDVKNKIGCGNYCWFPGLVELFKPQQIIELGGAMGVGDICILHNFPQEAQLYSITLAEGGKEFSFIDRVYPNFHPVIGDDLNLKSWPSELDLSKTDLWYFDSEHSEAQLRRELELYKPFFKLGAIVLFDDIHLNPGMNNVWNDMENIFPIKEKKDMTVPLHWSGYGVVLVGEKNE